MESVFGFVPHDALRAVDHLGIHFVPAVGGEAVDEDRVVLGEAHEFLRHLVGREVAKPLELFVLLAHRDPGVGDDDVCAGGSLVGVGVERDRTAGLLGAAVGVGHDILTRCVLHRGGDAHMHAGRDPAEHIGLPHVGAPVPEEGEREALQLALVLLDCEQIGEDLTRMEVVAERIDDGHPRAGSHLFEACLRIGAPDDRGHLPLEHAGGVGGGLLAAQLTVGGRDDQRRPAEIGDSDSKRHARTRG